MAQGRRFHGHLQIREKEPTLIANPARLNLPY